MANLVVRRRIVFFEQQKKMFIINLTKKKPGVKSLASKSSYLSREKDINQSIHQ